MVCSLNAHSWSYRRAPLVTPTVSNKGKTGLRGDSEILTPHVSQNLTEQIPFFIFVVPPYFVTRPTDLYGHVNEDAELKCDIRGYPEPTIYWLKVRIVLHFTLDWRCSNL